MKNFVIILFSIIYFVNINGQNLVNLDPQAIISDPINFSINPFNYIFFNSIDDSSFNQKSSEEISELINDKYVNSDAVFKRLNDDKYLNITINNSIFTLLKISNNNYRLTRFFQENQDYLLICRMNVDICDCGSEMKLFDKRTKKLISLERTFTFSIKKDVLHRLNKFNFIDEFPEDLSDYCTFLIALANSN